MFGSRETTVGKTSWSVVGSSGVVVSNAGPSVAMWETSVVIFTEKVVDTLETGSKIVVLLASIELTGINTWVVVASQLVLSIFSVGTVVVFSGVDAAVVDIVDAGDVIRGGLVGTIAEVTSNGVNVFLMILT